MFQKGGKIWRGWYRQEKFLYIDMIALKEKSYDYYSF